MRRIFDCVGSLEGGMLRARSSCLNTVGYIRSWQKAMREANKVGPSKVEVYVGQGKDWLPPIPQGQGEAVCEILDRMGRSESARKLRVGEKLMWSIPDNVDVIAALCGEEAVIHPSSLIRGGMPALWDEPDPSAEGEVPSSRKDSKVSAPQYQVKKLGGEHLLVDFGDGKFVSAGWRYQAMAEFASRFACQMELDSPGAGLKALEQFRHACDTATLAPLNTKVTIRKAEDPAKEDWAATYVLGPTAFANGDTVTIELADLDHPDKLGNFTPDRMEFVLP
jgi:hypothetical protein